MIIKPIEGYTIPENILSDDTLFLIEKVLDKNIPNQLISIVNYLQKYPLKKEIKNIFIDGIKFKGACASLIQLMKLFVNHKGQSTVSCLCIGNSKLDKDLLLYIFKDMWPRLLTLEMYNIKAEGDLNQRNFLQQAAH